MLVVKKVERLGCIAILREHPSCDLGFRKEYHVFDALWVRNAGTKHFYSDAVDRLVKRANAHKPAAVYSDGLSDKKLQNALLHVSFYLDIDNYANYFNDLYNKSASNQLVGDITPSYCGLTKDNFEKIRQLLEQRGFRVKVVFIMRDPVERIYSAIRMYLARSKDKAGSETRDPVAIFNERMNEASVEMRTRYERTFEALDAAFDSDDVYYGFYETLFSDAEVKKITEFLGVDYIDPDFDKLVNASPHPAQLDQASIAQARNYYDATYRACMDRFGESFIKQIWKNA